mgnify:CR=1 FL=1
MSQFFELHYHLPEDPARLFDVAQGLAGRRSILKRGGTVKGQALARRPAAACCSSASPLRC